MLMKLLYSEVSFLSIQLYFKVFMFEAVDRNSSFIYILYIYRFIFIDGKTLKQIMISFHHHYH